MSYQLQQFSLESVHLTLQNWQKAVQDDDLFALEYQDLFKWTESHIQYEDKDLESYAYGIFTKNSPNTAAHAIVDIIQRPHGRRQTKLLKLVVSPQFADDTDVNNLNTLVDLMLAAVLGTVEISGRNSSSTIKIYGRTNSMLGVLRKLNDTITNSPAFPKSITTKIAGRWLEISLT